MSQKDIDENVFNKERYEALRKEGVDEERARRIASAPPEQPSEGKTKAKPGVGKSKLVDDVRKGHSVDGIKSKGTLPSSGGLRDDRF